MVGPFTFNSTRFFVAFLAVLPFVLIFEKDKIIKYVEEPNELDDEVSRIDQRVSMLEHIILKKEK